MQLRTLALALLFALPAAAADQVTTDVKLENGEYIWTYTVKLCEGPKAASRCGAEHNLEVSLPSLPKGAAWRIASTTPVCTREAERSVRCEGVRAERSTLVLLVSVPHQEVRLGETTLVVEPKGLPKEKFSFWGPMALESPKIRTIFGGGVSFQTSDYIAWKELSDGDVRATPDSDSRRYPDVISGVLLPVKGRLSAFAGFRLASEGEFTERISLGFSVRVSDSFDLVCSFTLFKGSELSSVFMRQAASVAARSLANDPQKSPYRGFEKVAAGSNKAEDYIGFPIEKNESGKRLVDAPLLMGSTNLRITLGIALPVDLKALFGSGSK